MLDESTYLASAEPGEPKEVVKHYEVILTALDRPAELTVLLTAVYFDTGYDIPR